MFPPLRKRSPRRHSKRLNELPHHSPPCDQRSHQLLQLVPLPAIPLWRNLSRQSPHYILFHLLNARKPRLERVPSTHALIHFISRIHAPQRIVRKRPLSRVEAISLIDECRRILPLPQFTPESRLPSVRIPGPLVHHQHSGERLQIPHQLEHLRRKIVEHLPFQRTHCIARSEL